MKINLKKFWAVLLVLVMLISSVSAGFVASAADETEITDYVVIGSYNETPIRWKVLKTNADGSLLLISENVIAKSKFGGKDFETSTMYTTLNTDFYNAAFSKEEKAALVDMTVTYTSDTSTSATATGKVVLPTNADVETYGLTKTTLLGSTTRTNYWLADWSKGVYVCIVTTAGVVSQIGNTTLATGYRPMITVKADSVTTLAETDGVTYTSLDGQAITYALVGSAFMVVIDENYSESAVTVKANGAVIESVDGVYTATASPITVEGVVANPADYTAYNEAVSSASGLLKEDYTADSWAALEAALTTDVANLTVFEQAEVDAAAQAIADAVAALVLAPADFTAYNKALENAQYRLDHPELFELNAIAVDYYTYGVKLEQAIQASSTILTYTKQRQAEVDAAAEELADLVERVPYKTADISAWKACVDDAATITKDKYISDYVDAVQAVVAEVVAQHDYVNDPVTALYQADVDAAAKKMRDVIGNQEYMESMLKADVSALESALERAAAYYNNQNKYRRTSAWSAFAGAYTEAEYCLDQTEEWAAANKVYVTNITSGLNAAMDELDLCAALVSDISAADSVEGKVVWCFDYNARTLYIGGSDAVTRDNATWNESVNGIKYVVISAGITDINPEAFAFYAYYNDLTAYTVDEGNLFYSSDTDGVLFNKEKTELILYPSKKAQKAYTIPDGVTSIGDYAFYGCDTLKNITIPDGVTSIGDYAFAECNNLKSVTIGNGVTSIGNYAFRSCDSLESATIGNGVTSIGSYAFGSCDSLKSVTIPDSVTSIGDGAFSSCDSLESVTIPDSVTSIGDDAFGYCRSLESATIGNGVTSIGSYAFEYCESLESVTIGNGVTTIGRSAFEYCISLASITIPDGVTTIGENAFKNCINLASVTFGENSRLTSIGNSAFYGCISVKDVIYNGTEEQWGNVAVGSGNSDLLCALVFGKDTDRPYNWYGTCGENLEWILYADGELVITGTGAMTNWTSYSDVPWYSYCSNIKSVTMPDGITSIGDYAFYYCEALTSITISDSVTTIGKSAFNGCENLTSVTFGENSKLTTIGGYAFSWCDNLKSVTIPDGVTTIGDGAFRYCTALESVTIPERVTSIGDDAFCYCSNLESVTIPDGVTSIGDDAFYCCESLISITIPESVTSIGDYAFRNCTALTSVTVPAGVTTIGAYVFYACTGLTSVTFLDGAASIGNYMFRDCTGITSVTIPDSITSIGDYAFYGCISVKDVIYKGTEEQWRNVTVGSGNSYLLCALVFGKDTDRPYYWYGTCGENLEWILYADGELVITGTGAMANWSSYSSVPWHSYCNNIKSVTMPDGITSIGNYAFYYCRSLTGITIPEGVTSIGNSAFYNCENLASVTIPANVTSIGNSAFYSCSSLASVTFGENSKLTTISNSVFAGCSSLASVTIPDGVTTIGRYAFEYCISLASVTIPDSVTSIGNSAFYECSSVKEVKYKGTEEQWKSITVASGNSYLLRALVFGKDTDRPYYWYGTCGENLEWILYADGELVITGTGAMTDWSYSSAVPWYIYCSNIKSVTICDGVTSIGDFAFYSCDSLTSVTIGNSVTTIGNYAFTWCDSLTSVTIPDSVTIIGEYAFEYCESLESVTIGTGVTSIGDYAFDSCYSVKDVIYKGTEEQWRNVAVGSGNSDLLCALVFGKDTDRPYYWYGTCGENLEWKLYADGELVITGTGAMENWSSYSYVPWYVYYNNIKSVTLHDGITSIGDVAFNGCTALKSVTIPDSVISIGVYAFGNCGSLTSITIPDSVTAIGEGAFSYCQKLTGITVDENNPNYSSDESGVLFNKDKTELIQYPLGNPNTSYEIPDGVTTIADRAFYNCKNLRNIIIPVSVTSIGDYVFGSWSSIEEIAYKGTLEQWENVTVGTESLVSVLVLGKDTGRPHYLPGSCGKNLEWILYTDGELVITGTGAMENWSSYSSVPWHLYCSRIKSVTMPDGITSIGGYAFSECTALTSITIPDGVTSIGENAFYNCKNITGITVDENNPNYSSDESGALFNKGKTELIQYPAGNPNTSYEIPDSVTTVCNYAFSYCNSLESVTFGENSKLTTIESYAFSYCRSLASITIPDGVTTISYGMFENCQSLESVTFSENSKLTTIESYAFSYCRSLASITIPDGVTTIGENAFENCINLASVTFGENSRLTSIGGSAFYYCESLKSITIPGGVTSIGYYAFRFCSSLESVTISDGVMTIGEYVFHNCSSLESVTIGKNVQNIGWGSFIGCINLSVINLHPENKYFVLDASGILYTRDMAEIIAVPVKADYVLTLSADTVTQYESYNTFWEHFRNATEIVFAADGVTMKNDGSDTTKITIKADFVDFDSVEKLKYAMQKISSITVEDGNTAFRVIDGVLYDYNIETLLLYPTASDAVAYVMPDTVVLIDDLLTDRDVLSFGATKLESITYGKSYAGPGGIFAELQNKEFVDEIREYGAEGYLTLAVSTEGGFFTQFIMQLLPATLEQINVAQGNPYLYNDANGSLWLDFGEAFDKDMMLFCSKTINNTEFVLSGDCLYEWSAFFGNENLKFTLTDGYIEYMMTTCNALKGDLDDLASEYVCFTLPFSFADATEFNVSPDNPYLLTENGVLYSKDKSYIYKYPVSSEQTLLMLPENTMGMSSWLGGPFMSFALFEENGEKNIGLFGASKLTLHAEYTADFVAENMEYIVSCLVGPADVCVNNEAVAYEINSCIDDLYDTLEYYNCFCNIVTKAQLCNSIHEHDHEYVPTVTPPTCTNEGYTTHRCKICGDSYIDTPTDIIPHTYIQQVVVQPTCTQAGQNKYICSCGDSYTAVIPATGHSLTRVSVAPTCTEDGKNFYQCRKCFTEYNVTVVPATGHTAGDWETLVEPTCETEGVSVKKCTVCWTELETETIPANGHTEGDWETLTEPTCKTEGVSVKKCTACQVELETKPISATGHSYTENVISEPTCTTEGEAEYTCHCGDSYIIAIPSIEHDTVKYYTAPTCLEPGMEYFICNSCGNMIGDIEIIPETGHIYKWVVESVPTATESGSKKQYCTGCDETGDTAQIPATGFVATNGMVVDYANNTVYGLTAGVDSLDSYTSVVSDGCEWEYTEGKNGFGTGTKVSLKNGGETVAEYTIVIFGDINGDGWYDGEDAFIVNLIAKGLLDEDDVGSAIWTAADSNHDGIIDEADVDLLSGAGLMLNDVDQTKTVAELATDSAYIEYAMLIDQSAGMHAGTIPAPDADNVAEDTMVPETNETVESNEDLIENDIEVIITNIFEFFKKIFALVFSFVIK